MQTVLGEEREASARGGGVLASTPGARLATDSPGGVWRLLSRLIPVKLAIPAWAPRKRRRRRYGSRPA